ISLAGWFYDPEIELIIEMEKRAVHRLQRVLDSRLGFGLLALGAKWVPKGLLVFVGGAAGRGRVLPCRVSNAQSRPEKDEQTCSQTKRFHSVSSMNSEGGLEAATVTPAGFWLGDQPPISRKAISPGFRRIGPDNSSPGLRLRAARRKSASPCRIFAAGIRRDEQSGPSW